MYKTEQPLIEAFARQGPQHTAHVLRFVLVSIRRHFDQVERVLTRVAKGDYKGCTDVTRQGLDYVIDHADELYDVMFNNCTNEERIRALLEVPGIGIPKAGFAVQLLRGEIGCLDTHNIREYGLDAKAFRTPTTTTVLTARLRTYVDTCERLGGSEVLWNRWCEFIAAKYPHTWSGPQHVSNYHRRAIQDSWEASRS